MDISMPVMDGYEAIKKIRELEKTNSKDATYIVGLTAHATDTYKQECFESGMNEFSKYRLIA
jgi:CheY-like chemotaxis protein